MSGDDLVRSWKDPEERGVAAHPAGDIDLDGLNGGTALPGIGRTAAYTWICCPQNSFAVVRCPQPWPPLPGPWLPLDAAHE